MNKIIRNKRGFSLIEVLIGVIILSIGILAIAGMQITSITGTSFSNNLTRASIYAQERLEFLKSLPLDDARLDTGDYNDPDIEIFQRRYRSDRNNGLITLQYTVSWVDRGVTRSVSFSTIKGR